MGHARFSVRKNQIKSIRHCLAANNEIFLSSYNLGLNESGHMGTRVAEISGQWER